MTELLPRDVMTFELSKLATVVVADGADVLHVPADMRITQVHVKVGTAPTTSGTLDVTVYYTPPADAPAGSGLETAGDLWVVAAGVGRLAVGELYLDFFGADLAIKNIEAGGHLSLNVDAIDGGQTTANLTVTLYGYPVND